MTTSLVSSTMSVTIPAVPSTKQSKCNHHDDESCLEYDECNEYQPFLRQNKVSAITMTTSLVSSTSVTSTSRSFDKTK